MALLVASNGCMGEKFQDLVTKICHIGVDIMFRRVHVCRQSWRKGVAVLAAILVAVSGACWLYSDHTVNLNWIRRISFEEVTSSKLDDKPFVVMS